MNTKLCKVAVNTKQELIQLPLTVKDANDMATRIWHGQWWQIGITLAATSGVLFSWDSVTNPFVAQAGENLTIRGDKGIDILALNHPQTPFVSGGNLSLVSDGKISGDAHFFSGGNFSILNLSGSGGNFVSLYDPIIRSNGDVTIGEYTGASLKIESVGNITSHAITINSPDTSAVGDPDSPILTGGRALILRAGLDTLSGNPLQPNLVDAMIGEIVIFAIYE